MGGPYYLQMFTRAESPGVGAATKARRDGFGGLGGPWRLYLRAVPIEVYGLVPYNK